MKNQKFIIVFIVLVFSLLFPVSVFADYAGIETVDEMVQALKQECLASGVSGEYDQAVWMHDWLIYHADYDETLTVHEPEGVPLHGTGVCESYATAFQLLLNSLNIPCEIITSEEMEHAWNLVYLEGNWCHIDVTWDDPAGGGMENHDYFGMSDALITRDHSWVSSSYPEAPVLDNYYPLRQGEVCFSTKEELASLLAAKAEQQETPVSVHYIGTEDSFSTLDAVLEWISKNDWRYGIHLDSYSVSKAGFDCSVNLWYSEPWEKPGNHLDAPVAAPAFSMNSPEGNYNLSGCSGSGVILVFGRYGCGNTQSLLSRMADYRDSLNSDGIEILVSVEAAATPMDVMAMENTVPGYHYLYEQSGLLWEYLSAVGFNASNGVTYPAVFVVNGAGQIIYYSTGYVSDLSELLDEARLTANTNPLPQPDENTTVPGVVGNVNISSIGAGNVKSALQSACANSRGVFFLTDSDVFSADGILMQEFEEHFSVFNRVGLSLVACFRNIDAELQASFPHVTFVPYDDNDPFFWDLLSVVGYDLSQPAYYQSCYELDSDGTIRQYCNGGTLNLWSKVAELNADLTFELSMPASLTAIETEAFRNTGVHSVDLNQSSVTSIGSGAFADCSALTYVRIPASVTEIESGAFAESPNVVIICPYKSAAAYFAEQYSIAYYCP